MANFLRSLAAVLVGNAAYYFLMPYLPPAARHVPFKIDLGLVVDFWFCLVVFGVLATAANIRRRHAHKP